MLYIQLTLFVVCVLELRALASLSLQCTHKVHPQLPITGPGCSHSMCTLWV